MQVIPSATRIAALALLVPSAFTQQVIVVDAAGGGDHLDLPAAVSAADVGDVLLVRTGSYTAPTISKGLAIVADSGADVEVLDPTVVSGTPPGEPVLLSGLTLRDHSWWAWHPLQLKSCEGPIRLDHLTVKGASVGSFAQGNGGDAAQVVGCEDVASMRSTFKGGSAGEDPFGDSIHGNFISGAGMRVKSSRVAAWRTVFEGGDGSAAAMMLSSAGAGGAGMRLREQSELFGFLNLFQGGRGGDSLDFSSDWCGPGGSGLLARASRAFEQACIFLGGEGGSATNFSPPKDCDDGVPTDLGRPLVALPGLPRGLEGPRVLREGEVGQFTAYGTAGDRVSLAWSTRTAFRHAPRLEGGWISPPTAIALEPIGTIGGSGQLQWSFTAPDLPASKEARVAYVQLITRDATGGVRLGSPISIVVLDAGL